MKPLNKKKYPHLAEIQKNHQNKDMDKLGKLLTGDNSNVSNAAAQGENSLNLFDINNPLQKQLTGKAIEYFGGAKSLEIQQVRDKIKKEYAKKNKILFFEVKYNENIYERMNEILLIIKNKKTDSIFLKSVM